MDGNNNKATKPSLFVWAKDTALFIGTMAAMFAALSNSFNWCMQQLWGTPEGFWQWLWDRFLEKFGDDDYKLFVYGLNIWGIGFYWTVGMIYYPMYIFNWPKWTQKYKVQPGTNEPVEINRLIAAMTRVFLSQVFIGVPVSMACYWIRGPQSAESIHTLPNLSRVVLELVVFLIVEEIGFYYTHRILHHPLFYARFHKLHHQWTSPVSISATYVHPVEYLFSSMIPLVTGPTLMNSHVTVSGLWFAMVAFTTLTIHSGYHFPGMVSPESHDFHHLKFNECFGVMGFIDYLHGTDLQFRSSVLFKRHVVSWSLEPVSKLIPDVQSKHAVRKYVGNGVAKKIHKAN